MIDLNCNCVKTVLHLNCVTVNVTPQFETFFFPHLLLTYPLLEMFVQPLSDCDVWKWVLRSGIPAMRHLNILGFNLILIVCLHLHNAIPAMGHLNILGFNLISFVCFHLHDAIPCYCLKYLLKSYCLWNGSFLRQVSWLFSCVFKGSRAKYLDILL